MNPKSRRRAARWFLACSLFSGLAIGAIPDPPSRASLHEKYTAVVGRLHHNTFRRPLALDSSESSNGLKGDIYALIDHPFSRVGVELDDPEQWCDVLILHINTKFCRATTDENGTVLSVYVGKKTAQPLKDAYPLELSYRVDAATPGYLAVRLHAEDGPLSTRNYRIRLQAMPVGKAKTFLHLTYSYEYGTVGKLAMKTYLATIGSNKVGFTPADTRLGYVGGMRGVAERNTMRYYLAIDAYLGALALPPPVQPKARLQRWFAATEQYPRQLRELSRAEYLDMKRREYLRQQTLNGGDRRYGEVS